MKRWTLANQAKGRLRPEDRCLVYDLAYGCEDMLNKTREIYEIAGR